MTDYIKKLKQSFDILPIITFTKKDNGLYDRKLIKDSYKNLRISLLAVVVNATVFGFIFYKEVSDVILAAWYIAVLLISLCRYISLKNFENSYDSLKPQQWSKIFLAGVILSALTWGVTPFLFFLPGNYIYQMVLIVIIAGLASGAISSLSQILINVQLFLVLTLVPLIVELILQNTTIHHLIALLVSLYLLLLLFVSKKFHQNYTDAIKARLLYEKEREELSRSEQKFETIFKNVPIGVVFYDTDLIIKEINQEFIDFLEAPHDFLVGLDMNTLSDKRILPALQAPIDGIEGFYEGEYQTKYIGKHLWINMNTTPLKDTNNRIIGAIGIVADITQRMLFQQHIEHQANYDTLTDIPNRMSLLNYIHKEIARFKRHGQRFGIMFLDLDHFKNINDSLGHGIGDKLLIQTAKRLKNAIRGEDTVARLGGDEFVVLVPELGKERKSSVSKLEHIAQKIHQELSEPFEINGHRLTVSSSIGVTFMDDEIQSADDILKNADIAMYQAKKDGRNTTRFYEIEMDVWIKRRMEIENELRGAIQNKELELHYQPIIEFSTSRIVGAEALLRWNNQKLGALFPDEFIPIAEESGLILPIGEWVLHNAVNQFVSWQKQFESTTALRKIAVNVSVNQFDDTGFLSHIDDVIKSSGIQPDSLELELTESIIVKDINGVREKMQKLRDLGVNLSIDDFGTGYSSLSYLKKLPFSTLKIDKSFTQDIQDDMDGKELISTILIIAKNFNLEVVIEGVETHEQYLFAHDKNATYMQGYYCSKPMDKKSFTDMLESNKGVCSKLLLS